MPQLHIIIAKIGSGFSYVADELEKALVDKHSDSNKVAQVGNGGMKQWKRFIQNPDGSSPSRAVLSFVSERFPTFVSLNPEVEDLVLSGPVVMMNLDAIIRDYPGSILYFIDRVSSEELSNQASNFYANNPTNDDDAWNALNAAINDAYDSAESTHGPSMQVYKNFFWDLDEEAIVVEPSEKTTLSYLKRVGIVTL